LFLEHYGLAALADLPGLQEMKAAGLLGLDLPPGFEVPDPSRAGGEDEDALDFEGGGDETPEFVQDYVGDDEG
ncbi:MAG TPA: SMC-Scp complex subunit ScpB, partial [Caulobacter sp.]|nr:SMC-Scp complex subunit ScpB [Caulobacter sp.]